MTNYRVGEKIECPKCGRPGIVGVDKTTVKGHVYYYLTVRHYVEGTVKKCYLRRLSREEAEMKRHERTGRCIDPEYVIKLQYENQRLREEVERLKQQVAVLERENEELRERSRSLKYLAMKPRAFEGKSYVINLEALSALKNYYIRKRGYSPQQRDLAKHVLKHVIVRGIEEGGVTVFFGDLQHD